MCIRDSNAPESRRTDGSSAAPAAQPAPQPEPAPAPQPVVISIDPPSTGPAAPVAVRADVYSSTAAELFWARGDGSVVSYNIQRNGSFLDSTNGTSYFMSDLTAGNNYDVEIVAVGADGSVSPATRVSLQTRGDNNQSGNNQPSDNQAGAPPSPANASVVVYSSTAAELFWDRAATADNVVATDVYRNGLFLGVSPGNSYFDNTRQPGEQYQYELFAKNDRDVASSPTSVSE